MEDRYGKIPKTVKHYMLEKLYENIAKAVDLEKVRTTKTTTTFILSERASKTIHGDMLFTKANELSKHITLDYKLNKLTIKIDHLKVEKGLLNTIIPLLEILI